MTPKLLLRVGSRGGGGGVSPPPPFDLDNRSVTQIQEYFFLLFICDPLVLGCTVVVMHNGGGKSSQFKTSTTPT